MINKKKKVIALSVVALVLASLVVFGLTTYAWIDDVKLVEFNNDDAAQNNAPLKTGVDINGAINITKSNKTVDLGKMLQNSDITYSDNGQTHIKYDTAVANAVKNPDMTTINQKKGYFYESGGMHLSPCYSDGETFGFPQGQSGYREGNKDDENVNYISFTTKVSSPDANVDFWFSSLPYVSKHEEPNSTHNVNNELANARFAITVDGERHVYSSTGTANKCNSGMTGTEAVSGVRKTENYVYYPSNASETDRNKNISSAQGYNGNTLFSIKKGNTVNLNIKIWLEPGFDTNVTASDINLQLVSSWAYTRRVWIDDKTTGGAGESWLNNNSAKLYLTFPVFLKEINSDPAHWNDSNTRNKGLFNVLTTDASTGKYYVDVPLVYNNERMILYRCNSVGFNDNDGTTQRSEYNVYCWNWWQTITPNTFVDATYTLYGGSKDNTAKGYFGYGNDWVTDKGYGTWGAVEQISVYSHYGGTDYASKGEHRALYIMDYSDEDTSQEIYIYEMCRLAAADRNGDGIIDNKDPVDENDPWKTYVPVSSSKLKFRYFGAGDNVAWGYDSWNQENPQRRPLQSTGLYNSNSTVYHFARHFGGDKGWGYWEGAEEVYLIKTGFLAFEDNLFAYMFDSGDVYLEVNSNWASSTPRFAAYFYNGNGGNAWVNMSKVSDDTYVAVTPSGLWTNVIFARLDSNNSTNTLDNNNNWLWNKTGDLTYCDGQKYTLNDNSWTEGSWSKYEKEGGFPGDQLSALTYTQAAGGGSVYKHYSDYDSQVFKSDSSRVFRNVIFSKGDNTNQGNTLTLFPGCFYEPGENKTDAGVWYGSLDDTGRDAFASGDEGGGDQGGEDLGGDSTSGYTGGSDGFKIVVNNSTYHAVSKQTPNGTEYKVKIGGLSAGTHEIKIYKNDDQYKNGDSQGYKTYVTNSNMSLYITAGAADHNQEIAIQNFSLGNYIVTFHYDSWDSNRDTIMISSILKEG